MSDINELTKQIVAFRDERDWKKFHNAKDLAIALNIEAGELLELFLWKNGDEANSGKLKEELADVFCFALLLAEQQGLDVKEIIEEKLKSNALKYPVDKAKGNATKYTEL